MRECQRCASAFRGREHVARSASRLGVRGAVIATSLSAWPVDSASYVRSAGDRDLELASNVPAGLTRVVAVPPAIAATARNTPRLWMLRPARAGTCATGG